MIAWNTPPVKEKYDGVLRMSILGKPARQLWYDKYSPKETKEYDASNNLKFLYGHIIEHLLLYLAELSGHKVEDRQKKVKVDDVKGHMDAKVDGEICDVKSASPFSFKKFKNGEILMMTHLVIMPSYQDMKKLKELKVEVFLLLINQVVIYVFINQKN